jgi:hypothetical protein
MGRVNSAVRSRLVAATEVRIIAHELHGTRTWSLRRHVILGLLGVGGMGEVYRARHSRLRRDVALKVLPDAFSLQPDRLGRFAREAPQHGGAGTLPSDEPLAELRARLEADQPDFDGYVRVPRPLRTLKWPI